MHDSFFRPTDRQLVWLTAIGFACLGYALYLRYRVIEVSSVALACDAGLQTWICRMRRLATTVFNQSGFGWIALVAALVHLARPAVPLFALGLATAACGLVLYNAGLSALALALLIVSLARPARAAE
jgi:hypothetical protein